MTALPDLSRLKPTGGKRSSKREQIVNVFLRQEGHLSADDLVDIIRREDQRISRATVCRKSPIVAIGKKIPDRNSIGSWTTCVTPFAASSVFVNEAIT